MSVRPPKFVKVGGHTISVRLKSRKQLSAYGEFDPRRNAIAITSEACSAVQATTLLHEVLHACYANIGLLVKSREEEAFVQAFEPILFQVLRDNPKLIRYIQEA